jgi:IclR family acetate operon transcriptional repressor
VLDKVEGPGFLRAAPRVGAVVPVHATAVGKLHLAYAPGAAERDHDAERFTEHTRLGLALERDVEEVRQAGFAVNRDEWQPGLTAVAAPVFVGTRLVAAVAAAAPSAHLDADDIPALAARVCAAAAEVSARLAGRPAEFGS